MAYFEIYFIPKCKPNSIAHIELIDFARSLYIHDNEERLGKAIEYNFLTLDDIKLSKDYLKNSQRYANVYEISSIEIPPAEALKRFEKMLNDESSLATNETAKIEGNANLWEMVFTSKITGEIVDYEAEIKKYSTWIKLVDLEPRLSSIIETNKLTVDDLEYMKAKKNILMWYKKDCNLHFVRLGASKKHLTTIASKVYRTSAEPHGQEIVL